MTWEQPIPPPPPPPPVGQARRSWWNKGTIALTTALVLVVAAGTVTLVGLLNTRHQLSQTKATLARTLTTLHNTQSQLAEATATVVTDNKTIGADNSQIASLNTLNTGLEAKVSTLVGEANAANQQVGVCQSAVSLANQVQSVTSDFLNNAVTFNNDEGIGDLAGESAALSTMQTDADTLGSLVPQFKAAASSCG
jgi:uncharacterized protein HemX